jgi:hypothetical protein
MKLILFSENPHTKLIQEKDYHAYLKYIGHPAAQMPGYKFQEEHPGDLLDHLPQKARKRKRN